MHLRPSYTATTQPGGGEPSSAVNIRASMLSLFRQFKTQLLKVCGSESLAGSPNLLVNARNPPWEAPLVPLGGRSPSCTGSECHSPFAAPGPP
eukprot:3650968-Alexandrium_andersonii.AAC.1